MSHRIKKFQELTLADDFMFAEVMCQPELCKPFLEALLEKKIREIVVIDKQKDLKDEYDAHGIRLDVYVEDAQQTKYDIEMQTTTQKVLEKRMRYYQSGIDRRMLKKNDDYKQLCDSYIIFICLHDYYQRGFAVYERESCIKGARDIVYHDGSNAMILNADFTVPNASQEILDFLRYIKATYVGKAFDISHSAYLTEIDNAIQTIKQDEGKEKRYMTFAMKLRDTYDEGRKEGRMEGRKEGRMEGRKEGRKEGHHENLVKVVGNMLSSNLEISQISKFTGEPVDVIEKIILEIQQRAMN